MSKGNPSKKKLNQDLVQKKDSSGKDEDPNVEELKAEIVEVKEELESLNPHIFDGLDDIKKGELLHTVTQLTMRVERHHSGPLPSAETIIKYNSVIPNGADRIMAMAEKQQDHRMAMENKVITSQLSQSKKGQLIGALLCFLALAASVYLGMNDHETMGAIIGTTTIATVGGIFVLGKLFSSKDRKSDSKEIED
jgi:uncharacterized membrane protein